MKDNDKAMFKVPPVVLEGFGKEPLGTDTAPGSADKVREELAKKFAEDFGLAWDHDQEAYDRCDCIYCAWEGCESIEQGRAAFLSLADIAIEYLRSVTDIMAKEIARLTAIVTDPLTVTASQAREIQRMQAMIDNILLTANPWPLVDIVRKLCDATIILAKEKNYDGHGHELLWLALYEAEKWIKTIGQPTNMMERATIHGTIDSQRDIIEAMQRELKAVRMCHPAREENKLSAIETAEWLEREWGKEICRQPDREISVVVGMEELKAVWEEDENSCGYCIDEVPALVEAEKTIEKLKADIEAMQQYKEDDENWKDLYEKAEREIERLSKNQQPFFIQPPDAGEFKIGVIEPCPQCKYTPKPYGAPHLRLKWVFHERNECPLGGRYFLLGGWNHSAKSKNVLWLLHGRKDTPGGES